MSFYWPTVPAPRPIDSNRKVVCDKRGAVVKSKSDPRIRGFEQRWTDPSGKARRKLFTSHTEAMRFHEDLIVAKRDGWAADAKGRPISPVAAALLENQSAPTFDEVVLRFLKDKKGSWLPKSFQSYEPSLLTAGRWLREMHGASPRITQVDRQMIKDLVRKRRHTVVLRDQKTGAITDVYDASRAMVKDATALNFRKALNFVINYAINEKLIEAPGPIYALPRERSYDAATVEVAPGMEDLELLAGAVHPRFEALILMRGLTAIRPAELKPLRARDIDTETWWMVLFETETDVGSRYTSDGSTTVKGTLKSRSPGSTRQVRVPDHKRLRELLKRRVAEAKSPNDLVFTMIEGGPINWNNLRRRYFKPAVQQLWASGPLKDLTFYELRHAAVSWWVEIGVNEATAAAWAGHSVDTMNRYYKRLTLARSQADCNKVDEDLRRRRGDEHPR